MKQKDWSKASSSLLCMFVYGSMVLLLICLGAASVYFSNAFLQKEKLRAQNYTDMLAHSFELQYSPMTEEMWTGSYESIRLRVEDIASHLSKSRYEVVLADEKGDCVYSSGDLGGQSENKGQTSQNQSDCQIPLPLKEQIGRFKPSVVEPYVDFDTSLERYVYTVPLYVGNTLKGYLFASLTDPYQFYRGTHFALISKIFLLPFTFILVAWLFWLAVSYYWIIKPYLSLIISVKKKEALGDLALQVAHDIRSPSVALNTVVKNLSTMGPSQRRILTLAASRVEKIANDLLSQFGTRSIGEGTTCFLALVVESIVSEKRAVIGDSSNIDIEIEMCDESQCAVLLLSDVNFSRVLSNLLNNAVEAFEGSDQSRSKIRVSGRLIESRAAIMITDNGIGITPDVLEKIRLRGGSYGKPNGNGFGLRHAKEVLASVKGSLEIQSKPGSGTTVIIELPTEPSPDWCVRLLDFSDAKTLVVLDDDESVHALWKQRFNGKSVCYLTHPSEFDLSKYPLESSKYLIDYDLGKGVQSGLELIEEYGLEGQAVLCTSNFDNTEVQARAAELGCKILPKFMLSSVRINWTKVSAQPANKDSSGNGHALVLIDDDPMIRELWAMDAAQVGRRLLAVESLKDLDLSQISQEIPIYVDKNLGEGVSGYDVLTTLNKGGFQNLFLTTGEKVNRADVPSFVKDVRSKDFPVR